MERIVRLIDDGGAANLQLIVGTTMPLGPPVSRLPPASTAPAMTASEAR
jgi:hypothetical protein